MINSKNLYTASPQEVFDFVVEKMKQQNWPSRSPVSGACAYNGPNGRHCAAGWCITDLSIPDECNSGSWGNIRSHLFPKRDWSTTDELLVDLQVAHDSAEPAPENHFLREFLTRAKRIALKYHLNSEKCNVEENQG